MASSKTRVGQLETDLLGSLFPRAPLLEALFVPDLEIIDLAEHAHIADDGGAVAEQLRDDDAALRVEFARLAVVVDAVEELDDRRMVPRRLRQPLLDGEPHTHWIDAHRFAGHARDEDVRPSLVLDQAAEERRNLQTPLFVDTCR